MDLAFCWIMPGAVVGAAMFSAEKRSLFMARMLATPSAIGRSCRFTDAQAGHLVVDELAPHRRRNRRPVGRPREPTGPRDHHRVVPNPSLRCQAGKTSVVGALGEHPPHSAAWHVWDHRQQSHLAQCSDVPTTVNRSGRRFRLNGLGSRLA